MNSNTNWLSANLSLVDKVFNVENIVPTEMKNAESYRDFVDVYDTKEDFDKAFAEFPCVDGDESVFDFLKNIGTADIIDGKYVFFDYTVFDDLFPDTRLVEN